MTRNILVTGAAGFIGSCFAEIAIEKGDRLIALDLLTYAGNISNISAIANHQNFLFEQQDIRDYSKITELLTLHQIDILVNFAAESHVDNSISTPEDFISTNIVGTYTLLNAAFSYYQTLKASSKANFRYIQISTDEVFGSIGATGKFDEQSQYQPNSPYAASKAAADHLTKAWYQTYGLPIIITNCSNNYGPRQHVEKLIPKIITNALQEKELPIYGDGSNIRDWIYVEDHCHGINLAIEKGQIGQSYCFGGNEEKTNIELVLLICQILDQLIPRANGQKYQNLIKMVADRPGHDKRYAINDEKAVKELGFKRKYNFNDALVKTIHWYLAKKLDK